MPGSSKLSLKFVVEDFKQIMSETRSIESKTVKHKGLIWSIRIFVQHEGVKKIACFSLKCCSSPSAEFWSCNVYAELRILASSYNYSDWKKEFQEDYNKFSNEHYVEVMLWSNILNPQFGLIQDGMVEFEIEATVTNVNVNYPPLTVTFRDMNNHSHAVTLKCSKNKDSCTLVEQIAAALKCDPSDVQLFFANGERIQTNNHTTVKSILAKPSYGTTPSYHDVFYQRTKRVPIVKMVNKWTQVDLAMFSVDSRNEAVQIYVWEQKSHKDFVFVQANLNWTYGQFAEQVGKKLKCDPYSIQFYNRENEPLYPNLKTTLISMIESQLKEVSASICVLYFRQIDTKKSAESKLTCPICFDGRETITSEYRTWCATKCGHVFCSSCIEVAYRERHECPTCRFSLKGRLDFHILFI